MIYTGRPQPPGERPGAATRDRTVTDIGHNDANADDEFGCGRSVYSGTSPLHRTKAPAAERRTGRTHLGFDRVTLPKRAASQLLCGSTDYELATLN